MTGRLKDFELRGLIVHGYAAGMSCADIAKSAGSTRDSVKVIASKMGLVHPNRGAWMGRAAKPKE